MHIDNPPRTTIDFESRSACSLKNCGSWRYSLDITTEVMCLAFRLPYWDEGRTELWHPAFPHLGIDEGCTDWHALAELFAWILAGELVEAHNSWFERGIWRNIMLVRYGFPDIPHQQWRCSAAKAAAHALPRGLEDAGDACEADIVKDVEGGKTMKKMMKPRKPTRADEKAWKRLHIPCTICDTTGRIESFRKDGVPTIKGAKCPWCSGKGYDTGLQAALLVPDMPLLYHESLDLLETLWAYCRQDVLAEEAVSASLPDLDAHETDIFLMDQAINERGFALDTEAIVAALAIIDAECHDINVELAALTGGAVERVTQRARFIEWLEEQGLDLPNTQAATIAGLLEPASRAARTDITPAAWRGLELLQAGGKSSTSKYIKMANWICPDGRVHGGMLFNGASTGRWAGKGVQPHNFPRGRMKEIQKRYGIIMEDAWDILTLIHRRSNKSSV